MSFHSDVSAKVKELLTFCKDLVQLVTDPTSFAAVVAKEPKVKQDFVRLSKEVGYTSYSWH